MPTVTAQQINALLPQTQCGQCGFRGCLPYAEAIVNGTADINQCPPGGNDGVAELAQLLGVATKPLNTHFGTHRPKSVAFINEETCIGCIKCIAACPVDAIVGAAKFMHTVISNECTGCELCIAPCPMDCIVMRPIENYNTEQKHLKAQHAKQRYEAKILRKNTEAFEKAKRLKQKKATLIKRDPISS